MKHLLASKVNIGLSRQALGAKDRLDGQSSWYILQRTIFEHQLAELQVGYIAYTSVCLGTITHDGGMLGAFAYFVALCFDFVRIQWLLLHVKQRPLQYSILSCKGFLLNALHSDKWWPSKS